MRHPRLPPSNAHALTLEFLVQVYLRLLAGYYCETGRRIGTTEGLFYEDADPLWDGEGCGSTSTCCEFNNPPWFCKQLPQPTTEDIEVRICSSRETDSEDTPIELIELYIQPMCDIRCSYVLLQLLYRLYRQVCDSSHLI